MDWKSLIAVGNGPMWHKGRQDGPLLWELVSAPMAHRPSESWAEPPGETGRWGCHKTGFYLEGQVERQQSYTQTERENKRD
jgi:hypothetical protein